MPDTEFKYDVFISYSHKDEEWVVNTLLRSLEDARLKVCIDFRDFVPGKPARHNMRDACKESAYTVLVMTPAWMASEWTSFEGLLTFLHDPSGLRQRTVPILLEKCDIPEDIQILTYIDFVRKDRVDIAWRQLLAALGKPDAPIPGMSVTKPEPKTPESWLLAHPYAMPPNFTGRHAERNMLTGWLSSDKDHPLLIIRALGGFGKSALAWHWLTHDVDAKQYPAVIFWSFYEGDASFENCLQTTLLYLGVISAAPSDTRHQAESLLRLLQRPGILLILDGFERVLRAYGNMDAAYQGDELEKDKGDLQDTSRDCINIFTDRFLHAVAAYGHLIKSKILITTRLTPRVVEKHGQLLQGVREEELNAMQKDDAVEFFRAQRIHGTHTEIEAACEPYGYHPLSLRILTGLIANDRKSPGDISVIKNLEITEDIIQNKHHILEVAFNSLSDSQRKLLGRIACFRTSIPYDALKTLDSDTNIAFDESLKMLESRGILHWDRKTNKYDLHPIVRRFAYDRLTQADRMGAHERLVNYFEVIPKPIKAKKLEDLAPVIELYHHMIRAGKLEDAWDLFYYRITTPTYYHFGAYQLRIELLKALFPDGEAELPRLKEKRKQAWTLNSLANAYSLSGQPRHAIPVFQNAVRLAEERGVIEDTMVGLANLAYMAQIPTGSLSDAEHNLHRSIELIGLIPDIYWEAVGYNALGRVLSYRGAWQEAEQRLNSAFKFHTTLNDPQALSVDCSYSALRFLLLARADPKSSIQNGGMAIKLASQALQLADETAKVKFAYPRDYIDAYSFLGAAYRTSGILSKAEENLSKAISMCRQINLVDTEANILLELARLSYDKENFEEAKSLADEALLITERCSYVLQGADVNLFLAQYALEQEQDKVKAKEYAETALKLATCDGPPYYYKVAYEEAERMLEQLAG